MTCAHSGNLVVCAGTPVGKPRYRFKWCTRCRQKAWRRYVWYEWYGGSAECLGLRRRTYRGRPTQHRSFFRCSQRWYSE